MVITNEWLFKPSGVEFMKSRVMKSAECLARGKPILLFDFPDREAETDLVFHASQVTHMEVTLLRTMAGAPLTVYLPFEFASKLNLPRISAVFSALSEKYPILSLLASNRQKHDPLFSLTLDARRNFTGCSSQETAYTIRRLAYFVENQTFMEQDELIAKFVAEFKTPGHVPVIVCSKGLLKSRIGHAEMVLALAELGGASKVAVAAEMIDLESGKPLSCEKAISFAKKHDFLFLEGKDVLTYFSIPIPRFQIVRRNV